MAIPNIVNAQLLTASAVIGVLTLVGFLYAFSYYNKRQRVPQKWHAVGKVTNLIMYPLKSGRRMSLERAVCTEVGLQTPKCETYFQLRDRIFVIYKEGSHKYERNPKILQITVSAVSANHIMFEAPDMKNLTIGIPYNVSKYKRRLISLLYGETVPVTDCGHKASKWVSKYISGSEKGFRIGFNHNTYRRNIEKPYQKYLDVYPLMKTNASGLYSNTTSYLLLTQASVDDINRKVADCDITVHNFRPNIVVGETEPFAEDNWKWIKIGPVILYMVKYCTRCSFVTIDPETSERNTNNEPLKTLKTYRQLKVLKNIDCDGDECVMGINMALKNGGEIQVGDTVFVGEE